MADDTTPLYHTECPCGWTLPVNIGVHGSYVSEDVAIAFDCPCCGRRFENSDGQKVSAGNGNASA